MSKALYHLSTNCYDIGQKIKESYSQSDYKIFKKRITSLLKLLKLLYKNADKEEYEAYWTNHETKANNVFSSEFDRFINDLEYYSDRWCYSRWICVKRQWNNLEPRLDEVFNIK